MILDETSQPPELEKPMPLAFRTQDISLSSGTGRRSINEMVSFHSKVNNAEVAVKGFKLDYVNSDHHINIVEIDVDRVTTAGNDVHFRVAADYSDKNFDDLYRGTVTVLVIADVS
jgi:hypothetical protein